MSKNFALIGAAGFVAPRHLKAIKETKNNLVAALDKFDSVGIIDSFFPNADFFVEFERFDRHVDKLRRAGTKVDFVSICSPNYLHDSHIRFALRNQADAICEKPLVLNPWNIDALAELEQESGRKVNTVLQLRVHPALIALREKLLAERIRIRLCKGAYKEPDEIAFQKKSEVDANYVRLMKVLMKSGVYHGLATHDEAIINQAKAFAMQENMPRERQRGVSPRRRAHRCGLPERLEGEPLAGMVVEMHAQETHRLARRQPEGRCRNTSSVFHSKKPESFSAPTTSIIAKSRTIVLKSTERSASFPATTRKTTMAIAPIIAAPVRSILSPGNFPSAKTT